MAHSELIYEERGRVALMTLNRPDKLNAWTAGMADELTSALAAANTNAGIGAIVLTGAGRAFCAGADMGLFRERIRTAEEGGAPAPSDPDPGSANIGALLWESKPTICAINWPAIGVGLTFAVSTDIRIASDRATFRAPFALVGVMSGLHSTMLLPQHVGIANTLRYLLTGDMFDAAEAHRIGLVAEVVPADDLLDRAMELAARIAGCPPPQLRWVKRLIYANAVQTDQRAVAALEGMYQQAAMRSPAHKEAVAAFLEKREPDFSKLL